MEIVYIPKARIKQLLEDKKKFLELEEASHCRIHLNNEDNSVELKGDDALSEYIGKDVLFAYGRGFEPKIASRLNNEEYYLRVIDLREYTKNSERIRRIKSRIIGSNGKTKLKIEDESSVNISIYGDTISIIGKAENIKAAEAAAETIITGGSHKLAYIKMNATKRKFSNEN